MLEKASMRDCFSAACEKHPSTIFPNCVPGLCYTISSRTLFKSAKIGRVSNRLPSTTGVLVPATKKEETQIGPNRPKYERCNCCREEVWECLVVSICMQYLIDNCTGCNWRGRMRVSKKAPSLTAEGPQKRKYLKGTNLRETCDNGLKIALEDSFS
jgi:hypothetical protein